MRVRLTFSGRGRGSFLRLVLLFAGLGPLPLFGQPAERLPLRIGLAPEQELFHQTERFAPLFRRLETTVGVAIETRLVRSYEELLEELEQGTLDGALAGSFVAAAAVERGVSRPIARVVHRHGGATYRGLLLVRRDRAIDSVAALRGRVIAFVDPATTAGWIFPLAWLAGGGVDSLEGFLADWYFTGSHDAAIRAVLRGRADAAAVKDTVFTRMALVDDRVERDLVVLARSPPVPSLTLLLAKGVDQEVVANVRRTLLELERSVDGAQILADLGAERFETVSAEDFRVVLELVTVARPLSEAAKAE